MPAFLSPELAPRSRDTLTTLIDRVRGDLGLRDNAYVTDADITRWLNEAQSKIAREGRWFRVAAVVGVTAGTKEYEIPDPTSGRLLAVEQVWLSGVQLYPVALETLALSEPDYLDQSNGSPYWYYLRGATAIGLHPTPSTTALTGLTVMGPAEPPHISAGDDTFYVPQTGQDALVNYACFRASIKDAHGEGGKRLSLFQGLWEQNLRQIIDEANSTSDTEQIIVGEQSILDGSESGYPRVPFTTLVVSA